MVNQDRCNAALLFAAQKHEGQKMKQPIVSYVTHLQGVCLEAIFGCLNSKCDVNLEKVVILALLHDTMEDTNTTYEEIEEKFGKDIADGVNALTKDENLSYEKKMMDSLIRIKAQGAEVSIVKLADRIFNLKDVPTGWSKEKVDSYREEAMVILKELGENNKYMANRLSEKIKEYVRK